MRMPHLTEGLAAAALFLCVHSPAALRAQSSTGKLSVPEALGRLVPADAVGLLYLALIDAVQSDLQSLASLSFEAKPGAADRDSARAESEPSGADRTDMDLLAKLAEWLEFDAARIDRKRPLAIALNLYDMGRPTPLPVFILPAADPEGLLADLESRAGRPAPVTSGDYVGVALVPGYAPSQATPAIATALPSRKLTLRLHPDRIMAILQPFMEQGIEALLAEADSAGADSAATATKEFGAAGVSILRWYASLLQSCKTLDLGMEILEGRLDIDYSLAMLAHAQSFFLPPARARGLVELAKCLPKEYPLVSLVGMDFGEYAENFQPIFDEIMTDAARQAAGPAVQNLEWMTRGFEINRQVQDQVLSAMEFTKGGMELVNVYVVKDPTIFMSQTRELLQAPSMQEIGISVELAAPERIEGIPIVTYRLRFDLAKLQGDPSEEKPGEAMTPEEAQEAMSYFFGGDALVCRMGAVGNKVVTVCHPDPEPIGKVLAALKSGTGELPPSLGRVAAQSAAPVCGWFRADLRKLFAPLAELFLEATASAAEREAAVRLSTGRPVPVTIYTLAGEAAYEGTASVGIDALAELFQELDSLPKKDGAAKDSER